MFETLLKKRPLPGICAICCSTDGIAIARFIHEKGKPVLEHCEFYPASITTTAQQLKLLTHQYQLNRYRCTTVLNRDDYQLLVMEAPAVPKDELKSALRWRIKDLIDQPVADITLDAFDVPSPKAGGQSNSVYVVVAKNNAVKLHSENLLNADINLQIIDIMEMAQRNIANLLAENEKGVALLSVHNNSSLITVSKNDEFYLSRPINIGLEHMVTLPFTTNTEIQDDNSLPNLDLDLEIGNNIAYDNIALELQRALDYYESNFRQAPIRKLYLAPTLKELPGFCDYMKDNLNMSVELIDLNTLFECKTVIPQETQTHAFFSIGAALHRIDNAATN